MSQKKAAVVVPFYKELLSHEEMISLDQCIKVFKDHDIIFVVPNGLISDNLGIKTKNATNISTLGFSDIYFKNIQGYNNLLLSNIFYEKFTSYEFILIYQLDCYVFHDELINWCNYNYDYIGAPWLHTDWHSKFRRLIINQTLSKYRFIRGFQKIIYYLKGFYRKEAFIVGNGGFSIRKVSSFINAIRKNDIVIRRWEYNEDLFWGIYEPMFIKEFNIPTKKLALNFSFDVNPSLAFEKNRHNLPFGCHAWYRNNEDYVENIDFWGQYIIT